MENKNDLFDVLKDLLYVFDQICIQNNIEYSVVAGTLLGTIRHKGFIPWDDDVDVTMTRENYIKLMSLGNTAFREPYFFQSPLTDKGYHKGFCRLRNSDTTEISAIDAAYNCNHGAFIDIFPLDAVPDSDKLFEKQVKELVSCRKYLNLAARYHGEIGSKSLPMSKRILYYILWPLNRLGLFNMENIFRIYNEIASRYQNEDTKQLGLIAFSFNNKRFIYGRSDYKKGLQRAKFEDIEINIPIEFDSILRKSYGDYMTPVQEATCHGDTIFSSIPYKEYVKSHKKELVEWWMTTK